MFLLDPDAIDGGSSTPTGNKSSTPSSSSRGLLTSIEKKKSINVDEEEENGEDDDIEKELVELKEVNDKTLARVIRVEHAVELAVNKMQMQIHALLAAIFALCAYIVAISGKN